MEQTRSGFKKSSIQSIIELKLKQWVETITDEPLRDRILHDCIVTGGAITSMLLGQMPNDYDVYFKSQNVAIDVVNYYIKALVKTEKVSDISAVAETDGSVSVRIKSAGVAFGEQDFSNYEYFEFGDPARLAEYFKNPKMNQPIPYHPVAISSNAITLFDGIQIITRFTGDPERIHTNFDFVHCTNYYTNQTGVVYNQPALEATLTKELRYVGSKFPICSLFRIRKFVARGWTITAGEVFKIAFDVSKLDLTDRKVLEQQLIGVDQAYFGEVIRILNKQSEKALDRTYLFELVSRVFDKMPGE